MRASQRLIDATRVGAPAWRGQRQRQEAMWRARVRRPLILNDHTFPCDVIRREHSPPLLRSNAIHGVGTTRA